ncbi:MAG TPA: S41 family peptidase [Puia sp.]|nr:S41 family peptidase [Puia sp.]
MRRRLLQQDLIVFSFFAILLVATVPAKAQNISFDPQKKITGKPYFSDPSLSPDGSVIAFSSGGDIWTVPSTGGEARLLIAHPAYESRPLYSPDGKYLAFNSNRTGNGDVYILDLANSQLRRLTYDDGNEDVSGWSADGKYVYFSTASHDINAMRDVYRVRVQGGTPMPVSNSRYMTEFWAAPSPDGKTVAFDARGVASGQWWRNGHSHLDESEIWLWNEAAAQPKEGAAGSKDAATRSKEGTAASSAFERLTEGGAKDLWPMWSKDGSTLYFVSDRTGTQNLWSMPLHGKPRQLTTFSKGRVLWPAISNNGSDIVFERDFTIWKYNIASGKAAMVNIQRTGLPSPGGAEGRRAELFRDLKLSPDGKKIAFVSHGEIFVAAATGGEAFRTTYTTASESQLSWAASSNAICYVSDRDEVSHIYEYNFITNKETQLTTDAKDDAAPVYSPDGKTLAFVRDNKELRVLDRATGKETVLARSYMGRAPIGGTGIKWSPDGKWLVYSAYGVKGFRNVQAVPLSGGLEARPVSFLANSFSGNISWGENGKYILFGTGQRTETRNIVRVDLAPKKAEFSEDRFHHLFSEENVAPATGPGTTAPVTGPGVNPGAPGAPSPGADSASSEGGHPHMGRRTGVIPKTDIVFEGIHERASLIPLGGADVNDLTISKDGLVLVTASVGGQVNLYTWSADQAEREGGRGEAGRGGAGSPLKQLTAMPGMKSDAQFSPDGKEVFFLSQGTIQTISLDNKMVKPLPVNAEMETNFDREKVEVFRQAWTAQKKGYADPDMNGVDWNAVYKEYEPLAAGAATSDELRRILSLMVGELNSSHSGVGGGAGAIVSPTGRLGLGFDRVEYEDHGKFKVAEVVYGGPAALTGAIHVGDFLTAIDGKTLTIDDNLDEILENKVGRKLVLTVRKAGAAGAGAAADGEGSGATSRGAAGAGVAIKPINLASEKTLLYRQWVTEERAYIDHISNGRLGYVHMNDMGQESLDQLYLDLDVENQGKEGVVVDVRNNNGGFVNAYALDVLTRKPYLTMTNRGLPSAPARAQLGQRALEVPTILLTNQHSLSDAEDFTEGYRTLGLGKVVGEPTGGWIIYTSSVNLIDGSTVRLPFSKITDHEGKNMELHPRPVDIPVSNPIGQPAGKDAQAETAVKELLKELDAAKGK